MARQDVPWAALNPDEEHTWLSIAHRTEYRANSSIEDIFELHSAGLQTNRDDTVYDYRRSRLSERIRKLIADYNAEVYRHREHPDVGWPGHIKWSSRLKQAVTGGQLVDFEDAKIREALYRPFSKQWLYFDGILNHRVYRWPKIKGQVLWLKSGGDWPFFVLDADRICDHLPQGGSQCFPLSHLKNAALDQFREHYADDTITKESIFHYIYALLHHPEYRERYAANLKRELPRIPFAPDFHAFAVAGKELARLHVDYESLTPWPLAEIENKDAPYTRRVTKMKLSPDKQSLWVNESLTLARIPAESFEYRLGSRSALEWIVDQYQVKGESDPNREDDPGYIVRVVGQVVRVSIETVGIVKNLPSFLLDVKSDGDLTMPPR